MQTIADFIQCMQLLCLAADHNQRTAMTHVEGVVGAGGGAFVAGRYCGASSSRESSPTPRPVVELSSRASTEELPEQHIDAQQQQCLLFQGNRYAAQLAGHCNGMPGSTCTAQRQQQKVAAGSMNFRQRLQATCRLWPYMVPLFLVYFAEYAMQSGTWTAIGQYTSPAHY